MSGFRGRGYQHWNDVGRGDGSPREIPSRCDESKFRERNFRVFSPVENNSNRWKEISEVTDRCLVADIYPEDEHLSSDGRLMEGPLRAPVPGLARGLPVDRSPRIFQFLRSVDPHRRFNVRTTFRMAWGLPRYPLTTPDRVTERPPFCARLAARPQRP